MEYSDICHFILKTRFNKGSEILKELNILHFHLFCVDYERIDNAFDMELCINHPNSLHNFFLIYILECSISRNAKKINSIQMGNPVPESI